MLRKLTIQNYALIENLNFEFPDGLVIITGETGAGKSILLGALSLLLGAKADVSALKDADKNCVVEGEFVVDNQEIILRRVISKLGRSRNFINDEPVSLADLAQISSKIIDIHAQHQHLLLTNADYQMNVLDNFAATTALLKEYKIAYDNLLEVQSDLDEINQTIKKQESERDYKQFQFEKLQEAHLVDGQLEELENEQKQLANAEQIQSYLKDALLLLQPMDISIVQNLKEASHLLQKCSNFVADLDELYNRLESCRIECSDIQRELESKAENVVVSPQRLQQVEDRIGTIYSLFRKHSVSSVAQLIQLRDSLENELVNADKSSSVKKELEEKLESCTAKRNKLAEELSKARRKSVDSLSKVLQERIRDLQMPYAIFKVDLSDANKYGPNGKDKVDFLFSANGDTKLSLLQKAASGGELSRIMLCLKSLLAQYTGMPTMIFDEIDTGVSGSIADKMGQLIGKMGEKMQIFAITHLPQIASKKGTHLLVYKEFDKDKNASTHIKMIDGQDRVAEVARMLSGKELTKAAIENAKDLLKQNL